MRIATAELRAVDLPFRHKFKHAAAERTVSDSLFLRLDNGEGVVGWGESLPRPYVTGEERDEAFAMLHERVLPNLVNLRFADFEAVERFLAGADGRPPADWVDPELPACAAWACVDLALLDLAGRHFGHRLIPVDCDPSWRHSGVLSSGHGLGFLKSALVQRAFGLREIKVKVDSTTRPQDLARLRHVVGRRTDLRADANMAWDRDGAVEAMRWMNRYGFRSFEQPVAADRLADLAELVTTTGLDVMADESLSDKTSLDRLIVAGAATAVSVRISKCGGLVASRRRAAEAVAAGLWLQVGCQVGESSLLSAAQMALLATCPPVRYVEGAFGTHLLEKDPAEPRLQFGRGGRPPEPPRGPGFGVEIDPARLEEATRNIARVQGVDPS